MVAGVGVTPTEAHLNLILPAVKFTILDLLLVPEMTFCEDVAGTAFEVLLEMLSLFNRLERDIDLDLPRPKLGSMGTLPVVMIRESLTEVCGMTNVTPIGMAQAFDYVCVEHGLPSIAWNPSDEKSSFAKPMEDILRLEPSR